MANPHVKLSISLEEDTVQSVMGKGKPRSNVISEAIEKLLGELESGR